MTSQDKSPKPNGTHITSPESTDEPGCDTGLLEPGTDLGETEEQGLQPPDGGWGWVVVFGTFMVHVLCDGMAYSYGVYVESLIDHFNASYSEVGFLGSLLLGVTWGSGPISSILVNKFGCRPVAIAGTFIAATGFISSAFAPSIYFMYVSFGIVAGLGLGMIYLPAIVAVSFYFEKRRSFATGLAVCGSGVGTFLFAPLTQALVEEYGWQGSLLIETGLLLHCFICGAIFRPLYAPQEVPEGVENMSDVESLNPSIHKEVLGSTLKLPQLPAGEKSALGSSCTSLVFARSPMLLGNELRLSNAKLCASRTSINRSRRSSQTVLQVPQIFVDDSMTKCDGNDNIIDPQNNLNADQNISISVTTASSEEIQKNSSCVNITPPTLIVTDGESNEIHATPKVNTTKNEIIPLPNILALPGHNFLSGGTDISTSRLTIDSDAASICKDGQSVKSARSTLSVNMGTKLMSKSSTSMASQRSVNPMDRKDIFYRGSLANIPLYKSNPDMYRKSVLSIPCETSKPVAKQRECCLFEMLGISSESVRKLMDCGLLCDVSFLLFAVSNMLTSIGLAVPYVFIQDRAIRDLQTGKSQASLLISIIGAANMFGRVAFGFLADFKWVNRLALYNSVLTICGVFSLLTVFYTSYPLLAGFSGLFGMLMGIYICMTPIVIVDLLGLDKLSNAFGLVLLFQGIGGVIGPPLAGAVYDTTKDYNNSFYMMGICIFISGVMLYPIFAIQRCSRNKKSSAHEEVWGNK